MMIDEQRYKNEMLHMRLIVMFMCSLFVLSVPYIAMLFLLAGTTLFTAQFCLTMRIERHVAAFCVLLLYVFGWGLMTGGFSLSNLAQPKFYGGEGRIVIAYLPMLLIFAAPRNLFSEENINRIFRILFRLVLISAVLSAAGLAHQMFGSHHAAGYASGSMLIIYICLYAEEKQRWQVIGIVAALLMLMFANSRTTMVGLAFAFALYYRTQLFRPKIIFGAGLTLVAMVYLWSIVSPDSFARFSVLFNPELWHTIREQISAASVVDNPDTGNVERAGAEYNILTRIILWVRAVWFFKHSPLLGIGSFRYNDDSLYLTDVLPGIDVGASDMPLDLTVATAHNSFFHILAEGGLVGLVLYLLPWVLILLTLRRRPKRTQLQRALTKMSFIMIMFMMFGALTGHLLASPSITLWVTFITGLALRLTAGKTRRESSVSRDPTSMSEYPVARNA